MTTIESRSSHPIPPKRSFASFNEPDISATQPAAAKRLQAQAVEEAKSVQQPEPLPLKRPYTSFLKDFVDQQPPSSPASKRYRPESVVSQWLDSISGSGSYRERHCRSDTLLRHSYGDVIPRRLTKSAPIMECRRDANGFVLPPTPTSTLSRSFRADGEGDSQVSGYGPSVAPSDISGASTGSSRRSLVEDPYYRINNLAENNIYMRPSHEQLPEYIGSLVDHVGRDRDSPGPSLDEVRQDTDLDDLAMGTAEPDVEGYFKDKIFPRSAGTLKRTDRNPMAKHAVPNVGSKLKVSTPVPDMLYGYNRLGAFPQQQAHLRSIGNEIVANTQDLLCPFFVIEFKADGPGGSGSMWVATNQCLGGSVSCVNIAERLNRQLRQCEDKKITPIDSATFSIAMNGTEARLHISWKQSELDYYMRRVKSFSLQEPEQYVAFRKYVRNIIDWGTDKRLTQIRKSLDSLLEESRKETSKVAKSRPPPSDDSVSRGSHKRKVSRNADLGKGRAKVSVASVRDGSGWEWDHQMKANKAWNEGLGTSVYWDEEARAEKYWDGKGWQWLNEGGQATTAHVVYGPPSASFQENNRDEPAQIPAASVPANNEDDPFMQNSTAENGYTLPNGLTFPQTTLPQSSEDTPLPLGSSES